MKERLGLIDISGILHYIRHSKDQTSYGMGIFEYVKNLKQTLQLDKIILVQDYGKSTYRTEIYPEYKANRQEKELTKAEQDRLDDLRAWNENLVKFDFYFLAVKLFGVEADDLAGILFHRLHEEYDVTVITVDKDFMTTIPLGYLFNWYKNKYFDLQEDRQGLSQHKFLLWQTLQGDAVDNIKGVCGKKTALILMNNFENFKEMRDFSGDVNFLEGVTTRNRRFIIQALEDIKDDEVWDRLKLNYKLVKIFTSTDSLNPKDSAAFEEIVDTIRNWQPKDFEMNEEMEKFLWSIGEPMLIDFLQEIFYG